MTIGRPIEFDPDVALEAAMQHFWRKGYEATSLQALIDTMGLSKSSFYQTFTSKHTLFLSCLLHYDQLLIDGIQQQRKASRSGKTFISELLLDVMEDTMGPNARRGCLVTNTAAEFAQSDLDVAKVVSGNIEKVTNIFEAIIKEAQEQGEIQSDKDPRALAGYLMSSWTGLRISVKAGASAEAIKQTAQITLSVFN